MAGDTIITIVGNLTADPEMRFTPSGAAVASFTVASTPRTFDRQAGEWKDGETLFMRCSIWRDAAENVAESLTKGTRVIVQGRLVQRSYTTREGENRTVVEMQVDEIGPSLRYAKAQVTRQPRGGGQGGFGGGQGGPQGGGVGVALEELGSDGVDARVGGLGRQDGGHEQLEGAVVLEGAGGVGVEGHELVVDGARTPGRVSHCRHLGDLGDCVSRRNLTAHCPAHGVLSPRSHRQHQCHRDPRPSPGPAQTGPSSRDRHCSRSHHRPATSWMGPCHTTHPILLTPL